MSKREAKHHPLVQPHQIQCQTPTTPATLPSMMHAPHNFRRRNAMDHIQTTSMTDSYKYLFPLSSPPNGWHPLLLGHTTDVKAGFGKKHKTRATQSSHRTCSCILHHDSSTLGSYLLEVMLCELVSNPQQFTAGVSVSKSSDAQAIGRVQLSLKELAAGLLDLSQLEKASSWQQGLDISLFHSDLRGVCKVNQQFHGPFVDVSDHYFCLPRFCQLPSEHGSEVRAAGRQNHPVGIDLLCTDY